MQLKDFSYFSHGLNLVNKMVVEFAFVDVSLRLKFFRRACVLEVFCHRLLLVLEVSGCKNKVK